MSLISLEEFDRSVKEAIKSLDLEARMKDVDSFQSIHLITSTHYSTLIHLGEGKYKIEPNYKKFGEDMDKFVESEFHDYYTWGFVPLDNESRELLIITPRLTILFGRVVPPLNHRFDLYLMKP